MKVVIRADASVDVGSGHVMRCLALAEGLRQRAAQVVFVCRRAPGDLCDFLAAAGHKVYCITAEVSADWREDAAQTIEAARGETPVDWLVVDHYALDSKWESTLRPHVAKIMVIDDLADRNHECDLLLDQNYYCDPSGRYTRLISGSCMQLLGPRFALLRPEFAAARPQSVHTAAMVKRVFIFLSGADAGNVTGRVLQALDIVAGAQVEVDIAVGIQGRHIPELTDYCSSRPGRRLHIQTSRVAHLLTEADLAIGAGGATSLERACMGVPSLVLGLAKNQVATAAAMASSGAHLYLGSVEELEDSSLRGALAVLLENQYLRAALAQTSFRVTDGRGVRRVVRHLLPSRVEVRRATGDDCDLFFVWRNHPDTRRHSFDAGPLSASVHRKWFAATLADHSRALLIGTADGKEVGVLRYDFLEKEARVSIYLDPARQGEGHGPTLLAAGTTWLRTNHGEIRSIVAEVLPTNERSMRAFLAAGFRDIHHHLRLDFDRSVTA